MRSISFYRKICQLVEDRPRNQRIQPVTDPDIRRWLPRQWIVRHDNWMVFVYCNHIVDVGPEQQTLGIARAILLHFNDQERRIFNSNPQFLGGRDEAVAIIVFAHYRGQKPNQPASIDRRIPVVPRAVPGYSKCHVTG